MARNEVLYQIDVLDVEDDQRHADVARRPGPGSDNAAYALSCIDKAILSLEWARHTLTHDIMNKRFAHAPEDLIAELDKTATPLRNVRLSLVTALDEYNETKKGNAN